MRLDDLGKYEHIAIWGAGVEFKQKFRKQFHVSYLLDKDVDKQGEIVNGLPVASPEILADLKNVLVVISSTRCSNEILSEIKSKYPGYDAISLDEILYVLGRNQQTFCLWGIDAFVRDICLRGGHKLPNMSYIEIGCNHPFYGSATASFYLAGAHGILIEPDERFNSVINDMRPRDTLLNCGIGKKSGEMTFYRMDNSYRSSFDIEVVRLNEKRGFRVVEEVKVPVRTLDWVIETYNVDAESAYLSIPSMGAERDVLDGYDHKKYPVPVLSVGFNSADVLQARIFEDYKVIGEVPRHKILVRNDIYERIMG